MTPIIPAVRSFDRSANDPPRKRWPGAPAHPKSAYFKAALVRINEHHLSTPRWRAYLLDHPLLAPLFGSRVNRYKLGMLGGATHPPMCRHVEPT